MVIGNLCPKDVFIFLTTINYISAFALRLERTLVRSLQGDQKAIRVFALYNRRNLGGRVVFVGSWLEDLHVFWA
jgi:hypothetical protein